MAKPALEFKKRRRQTVQELQEIVGPVAEQQGLVSTRPAKSPAPPPQPTRAAPAEGSVTLTFKASRSFAKVLMAAGEREGGLRKVIARLAQADGMAVPDRDLNPPQAARRSYD
jgi:hypothetical protein